MSAFDRSLDVSARAGVLLAAATAGMSTQPNLLTRGTPDQALITGLGTAAAYGLGVSGHSFLRSVRDRLPLPGTVAGLLVDGTVAAAGAAGLRAIQLRPADRWPKAIARLAAMGAAGAGSAGMAADLVTAVPGTQRGHATMFATMTGVGVGAWALTRNASVGSVLADGTYFEDSPRTISRSKTAALGVVTGAALYGLAHAESALSTTFARGAARALGGSPDDHRALGRIAATAASYGVGWLGLAALTAKLTGAGSEVELANKAQPQLPEVTGSPASNVPWDKQSREGTRFLSEALLAEHIESLMREPAKQPIRVYASLDAADTEEARAELLLAELDRTNAFERGSIALFSPTGSGYVNYVACETFEYLTRGDCASMAIEYSVLPSALSLTRAQMGTRQTQLVVAGVVERLMALPADRRPRFFMFGESLGSRVSEEIFTGASDAGPRGVGLDGAVWVGTPAFTKWRKELWGNRPQAVAPEVGPGAVYVPRAIADWHGLSDDDRANVRYLLLQNGDDPVPKFEAPLLWRPPDWLGPDSTRPIGAPRGTHWLPLVTFVSTFTDLMNALTPTPGVFVEGGHDYRLEIPDAIRTVWRLDATDEQLARINEALRRRELGLEVERDWQVALAKTGDKRDEALAKVERQAAEWTGAPESLTPEAVQQIIEQNTQPE